MEYLALTCHCTIMLVFGVSAIGKSHGRGAFDEFSRTTRTMLTAVVPRWSVRRAGLRRIAGAVVAAELAIPVLVGVPVSTRWGHGACMVLLGVFSFGMTRRCARCAHLLPMLRQVIRPVGAPHLVWNALVFGTAVTGLVAGPVDVAQADGGLVVAAAAAVVLTLRVVRLDDVIALFTDPPSAVRGGPTR